MRLLNLPLVIGSRNPCFSGQCFAIKQFIRAFSIKYGRNPCFSGQFFAIYLDGYFYGFYVEVAILVLVDSVLQ